MIWLANETTKNSTLTTNSINIFNPVSDILDSRLSRVYKTEATTTTAEIVYNAGSAVTVTAAAIANHNITSSVTTLKIQGNATDVWTSPSVDETLTWSAGIISKTFTGGSYQYWRIQIIDATNPDTYIKIGRAWLGESFSTPELSPSLTHSRVSASLKSRSVAGQSYQDKRYFYSTVDVSYPAVTHTEKASIITQFEIVDTGTPFFVLFNETCIDLTILYATIEQDSFSFELLGNTDYYTVGLGLTEEV